VGAGLAPAEVQKIGIKVEKVLAVPEDGDPIGNAVNLLHPMRDVDNGVHRPGRAPVPVRAVFTS
jgi:hypothetical protein